MKSTAQPTPSLPRFAEREPTAARIGRGVRGERDSLETKQIVTSNEAQQQTENRHQERVRAFAVATCCNHKFYTHGSSPRC